MFLRTYVCVGGGRGRPLLSRLLDVVAVKEKNVLESPPEIIAEILRYFFAKVNIEVTRPLPSFLNHQR